MPVLPRPDDSSRLRVVLFSGGRGSGALAELLADDERISLTVAIRRVLRDGAGRLPGQPPGQERGVAQCGVQLSKHSGIFAPTISLGNGDLAGDRIPMSRRSKSSRSICPKASDLSLIRGPAAARGPEKRAA